MLFFLLTACTTNDGDRFHGGSGSYDAPKWGDTGGGDTSDSTGDTATHDPEGDPGAPVFSNVNAEWSDYPNLGVALEVTATYTDDDDDIEGGACYIDITSGSDNANFDTTVGSGDDDGCKAVAGTFIFAILELDDSKKTLVEFQVKDSSGNLSKLESVEVAGQ